MSHWGRPQPRASVQQAAATASAPEKGFERLDHPETGHRAGRLKRKYEALKVWKLALSQGQLLALNGFELLIQASKEGCELRDVDRFCDVAVHVS